MRVPTPAERQNDPHHSPFREQLWSPTETGPNTGSLDISHAAALAEESAASSQQENPTSLAYGRGKCPKEAEKKAGHTEPLSQVPYISHDPIVGAPTWTTAAMGNEK